MGRNNFDNENKHVQIYFNNFSAGNGTHNTYLCHHYLIMSYIHYKNGDLYYICPTFFLLPFISTTFNLFHS